MPSSADNASVAGPDGAISRDAAPDPKQKLTVRQVLLLVEMLLLALSVMATETTISPALPRLTMQYPDHQSWVPWTMTAYNVVGAVWTPLAGSLGDIFGVKWITIASLVVYLVGEIGCGLARDIFVLIVFRAIQGVGMGIFILCFSAIKKTFPKGFVPVAVGIISSMFSVGVSFGFIGGAAIIKGLESAGTRWEYVFLCYIPFLVLVIIAFFFTMPNIPRTQGRRIDPIGSVLLSIAVIMILCGLTLSESRGWKDAVVLCLVIIGCAVFVGFVVTEKFIKDPLVDVALLLQRNLLTVGCVSFIVGMCMFSFFQMLPYIYQFKFGYTDPIKIGLLLLPIGLVQLPTAPVLAILGNKVGFPWLIMGGTLVMVVCSGVYIKFHENTTQAVLINIATGFGMTGVFVSLINVVSENTKPEQFGIASGTNTLMRILGSAVGPVALNMIMFKNAPLVNFPVGYHETSSSEVEIIYTATQVPLDSGYRNGFILTAALAGFAFVVSLALGGKFKSCKKRSEAKVSTSRDAMPSTPVIELSSVPDADRKIVAP
eukprot:m51a1_g6981 hypothetical protein (543) ;mRNA; r:137395-139331